MGDKYKSLSRASLSLEYLHANATTHEFLFGAVAELIDNSRDADATSLYIYSEQNDNLDGGFMLFFLDDGCGMSPQEACDLIYFGRSAKRLASSKLIGKYGNGLKSGSMRIGKDFILFTKKGDTMTCILFSQTFCEAEGLDELIVPMPCWYQSTKDPLMESPEKFNLQMSIIWKYSPFKTEWELLQQFDLIYSSHGTLIIIYNLTLMTNGEPELDFITDTSDILNAGMESLKIHPELWSLRSYTSVLYFDPRMKIFIQAERVCTKQLMYSLYRPRMYPYKMPSLRASILRGLRNAEMAVKTAEQVVADAELRVIELKRSTSDCSIDKEMEQRLNCILTDSQKRLNTKREALKEKQREEKQSKYVYLTYGLNIKNRSQDGMFIYHNSRLIRMHEKVGKQLCRELSAGAGVLGLVNVPSEALLPTHNKQNFLNGSGYHHLLRYMGQFLDQYLKDSGISQKGAASFWTEFGYLSGLSNWFEVPSDTIHFKRKLALEIPLTIQCDLCLKWRILPFSPDTFKLQSPDNWTCTDNPDGTKNSCEESEQLPSIPFGTLHKGPLQLCEKEKLLRCSVQRHEEKLFALQKSNLIQPHSVVPSAVRSNINSSLQKNETFQRRRSHTDSFVPKRRRYIEHLKSHQPPHNAVTFEGQVQKVTIPTDSSDESVIFEDSRENELVDGRRRRIVSAKNKEDCEANIDTCISDSPSAFTASEYVANISNICGIDIGINPEASSHFSPDRKIVEKLKFLLREVLLHFLPDCTLPIERCICNGESLLLSSLVEEFFKEYEESVIKKKLESITRQFSAEEKAHERKQRECEAQIQVLRGKMKALRGKAANMLTQMKNNVPDDLEPMDLYLEEFLQQDSSPIEEKI
ncbi:MORC family CW-type zinc finger protein 1 isoform X2 [Ascaphus truei]|uniref:MORC family CW-type zinc finger protein 1 isoform X2 n=1 Tax=Ascaphus truei TaxID=8439 RepID=UPI003F5ACE21